MRTRVPGAVCVSASVLTLGGVMEQVNWPIDFAFPFPAECTQDKLVAALEQHASKWPGWDNFPWRVTRSIHEFIGRPPASFHYLMTHHCMAGYAAHLVLSSTFENRQAVLALILREKFEIVGMFRALLLDAMRAEMRRTKLTFIEDCSGPDDGQTQVPADELAKRRDSFRACVAGADREFVQILNLASQLADLDGRLLGRSLQTWARGGDMPAPMTVPVQMEVTPDGKVVKPYQTELLAFLESGMTVPRLVIGGKRVRKAECGARSEESATEGDLPVARAGRLRVKQVAAGRERAVVKDRRDRTVIRSAVRRLVKMGLSHREACCQVSDQAKHGRVGECKLTMKYDIVAFEATPSVVRRVSLARW